MALKSCLSFFLPEAVWCPPSNSVDVHPFRHIRWYVPSWTFSRGRSIPGANLGPQSWTGPFTRFCSQYDGTQSWTWNTQCTSWHAGPGTKWLLSGQHVSYAQGTVLLDSVVILILSPCSLQQACCCCMVLKRQKANKQICQTNMSTVLAYCTYIAAYVSW